jgi:ATP-dependent RNA helicase DDX47/RRP3
LECRYDVELYQRTEQLIGKKLDGYPAEEAEVLVFLERVTEAQRVAAMEMRETGVSGKKIKAPEDTEEVADEAMVTKRKAKPQKGGKNFRKKM